MSQDAAIRFLYGTKLGRALLRGILYGRLDRLAVCFLSSPFSKPLIGRYVRRHHIAISAEEQARFSTFRDFFARTRTPIPFDQTPSHLISPCDSWLSVCPVQEDSRFCIKGFSYRLCDLLDDPEIASTYPGGLCLIFRLTASDYHHYCYIDDGFQGENHFLPGTLHSVQPLACEQFPVYTLNRRSWSLLSTEHFGPVVQTEVGALIVGGIVNERSHAPMRKGEEMGHFELMGSTIVLFFQKDRIQLLPQIAKATAEGAEYRTIQGEWIGRQISVQEGTG